MCREIKFRAWNKNKEIMVYKNEDGESYYWDGVNANCVEIVNNRFQFADEEGLIYSQYTGFKDKNGKEIYDGDIIKYSNFPMYGECKEFISRVNITPFGIIIKSDCGNELYLAKCFEKCEVIGNIYANPELLELILC